VALSAVLLTSLFCREPGQSVKDSAVSAVKRQWLLFGCVAAVLLLAVTVAFAGRGVSSILGRYAVVSRAGTPDLGHFLNVLAQHFAELDFAAGIVPFAAALVTAFAFVRLRRRREHVVFAAVAVAATTWLLLEVAWDAAVFDSPTADVPRIHERFLIYVLPFFLVALVASVRLSSRLPGRVYVAAAVISTLLPAVIDFHTMINDTVSVDSFGLEAFGRQEHLRLVSIPHATLYAMALCATVTLLYAHVRNRMRTVVMVLLVPFILSGGLVRTRVEGASVDSRLNLPAAHADWVDHANPVGDVVLVTWRRPTPELQTVYSNFSIKRLYYLCMPAFGADFGEQAAKISRTGRLVGPSRPIKAAYVVAPAKIHLSGRIVARNRKGHELLVAPLDSRVSVAPARRGSLGCRRRR
jgi:hypothetical protein